MSCQNFDASNIASSPPFAMATPTNSSGNLVDEFEEAFQSCLNVLTKDEAVPTTDKEEIRVEVEQTTLRFIDLARQMEAFFLQKRFLLSALKPEMVVKEDVNELRLELARKEELLKRHNEKIAVWQNLLNDLQSYAKSPAQAGGSTPGGNTSIPNGASSTPTPMGVMSGTPPVNPQMVGVPVMPPAMQQQMQAQQQLQMQQQQLQAQIQQQQQQMLQQQMQVNSGMGGGPGIVSPQQAMFMQQGMGGPRGAFSQQGPGGVLQGPLAYLEKTTSNIDPDVLGMADGRR